MTLSTAHLFLISGFSGGGKSTLIDALAKAGYAVLQEPGRRIVKGESDPASLLLPWNSLECFAQRALEMAISDFKQALKMAGPVFFDRGVVDAASALQHSTGSIDLHEAVHKYRYNSTVLVAPPWEALFSSDEERRHDFCDAFAEYKRLVQTYEKLGYDTLELPKVPVEDRLCFILEAIRAVQAKPGK